MADCDKGISGCQCGGDHDAAMRALAVLHDQLKKELGND